MRILGWTIIISLALFVAPPAVLAQQGDDVPKKDLAPKKKDGELVRVRGSDTGLRMSEYVIFVVDISGSMHEKKFVPEPLLFKALRHFYHISTQPTDRVYAKIIGFSTKVHVWPAEVKQQKLPPGIYAYEAPGPSLPTGWVKLPNEDAILDAQEWLAWHGGNATVPGPALKEALACPLDPLTIVYITDGVYHNPPVVEAIRRGLAKRGKDRPVKFYILGVSYDIIGVEQNKRDLDELARVVNEQGDTKMEDGDARTTSDYAEFWWQLWRLPTIRRSH